MIRDSGIRKSAAADHGNEAFGVIRHAASRIGPNQPVELFASSQVEFPPDLCKGERRAVQFRIPRYLADLEPERPNQLGIDVACVRTGQLLSLFGVRSHRASSKRIRNRLFIMPGAAAPQGPAAKRTWTPRHRRLLAVNRAEVKAEDRPLSKPAARRRVPAREQISINRRDCTLRSQILAREAPPRALLYNSVA